MSDSIQLALYGATGVLGREILVALEGEGLEELELVAVAGGRSAGQDVPWPNGPLTVLSPEQVKLESVDIAIFATPPEVSERWAPALRDLGALVIDCSGATHSPTTSLAPGFDHGLLEDLESHISVASPAAAALCPLVAAAHGVTPLSSITATVLIGASMSGREGQEALSAQTVALLSHRMPDRGPFGSVLAFNLIPGGPRCEPEGDPWAELTRRDLRTLVPSLGEIPIRVQVVQVPIFSGVAITASLTTQAVPVDQEAVMTAIDARDDLFRSTQGRAALRDGLGLEGSLTGDLRWDEDGALECWVISDALQRTAMTVSSAAARVVGDELW